MKAKPLEVEDELRPEYDLDFSKGVRGKYFKPLMEEGANVVMLEPDVAKVFTKATPRLTKRSGRGGQ